MSVEAGKSQNRELYLREFDNFQTIQFIDNFEYADFRYENRHGEVIKGRDGLEEYLEGEFVLDTVIDLLHSRRKYFTDTWRAEIYPSDQKAYLEKNFERAVKPGELENYSFEEVEKPHGYSTREVMRQEGDLRVVLNNVREMSELYDSIL